MTTTPLPPRPSPAFKLNYDKKTGWYFVNEPGVGDTWCFTSFQLEAYATQARADLEAEVQRLREALQNIKHMKTFAIETTSIWCPLATEMVEIAIAALEPRA